MLIKWNERVTKDLEDNTVTYTVPVEGKIIVSVAKRALTAKVEELGATAYRFAKVPGGIRIYAAIM